MDVTRYLTRLIRSCTLLPLDVRVFARRRQRTVWQAVQPFIPRIIERRMDRRNLGHEENSAENLAFVEYHVVKREMLLILSEAVDLSFSFNLSRNLKDVHLHISRADVAALLTTTTECTVNLYGSIYIDMYF